MAIVVKKFGGTSVGDIARIKKIAKLVKSFLQQHPQDKVVVVVSAMAGETNRLLALGHSVSASPAPRELDMLAATGEQVSSALLAMAFADLGINASSLLGLQAGITTTSHFCDAQVLEVNPEPILKAIDCGVLPVIAGFQGRNEHGDITTLGRGGSDISAVAVAAALSASACYIYTDVDGVFSADPRICPNAKILPQLSHEEMLELATLGAKVLHPRAVYFAMRYKVPLVTLSSFNPNSGTWIVQENQLMEHPLITGITCRSDEARILVTKIPGGISSLQRVFSALADNNIVVDVITQTGIIDDCTNISFTVADGLSSIALEVCQSIVPDIGAEGATVDRDISKVSVVGIGIRNSSFITAQIFATLARHKIEVQMIATSEIKISVIVPRKYGELAVRSLHADLIENSIQGYQVTLEANAIAT